MMDRAADFFDLVEKINQTGPPEAVAAAYHTALRDRYWKLHDLPGVIERGRAGILYCLAHSLRSQAKAMAFDVGSFTWPGWEEAGIEPTVDDLSFGRQCAALNLKLAIELNKPPDKVASAHWLVGAHALTAGDSIAAVGAFQAGMPLLTTGSPFEVYLRGCCAAGRLQAGDDPSIRNELDRAMQQLSGIGDADSLCYLDQVRSIVKLYLPAAPR
jgi:hypothetical protein